MLLNRLCDRCGVCFSSFASTRVCDSCRETVGEFFIKRYNNRSNMKNRERNEKCGDFATMLSGHTFHRVLEFFLEHPQYSFYLNDIAKEINVNNTALKAKLYKLLQYNIIEGSELVTSKDLYQLKDSEVTRALRKACVLMNDSKNI